MATLSDSELLLYQTSFDSLCTAYQRYNDLDNQIKNHIDFDNLDPEDIIELLKISSPSMTRFKLLRKLNELEGFIYDEY